MLLFGHIVGFLQELRGALVRCTGICAHEDSYVMIRSTHYCNERAAGEEDTVLVRAMQQPAYCEEL